MSADPAVILTQEPQDNAQLVALLAERGIRTIDYPCIATRLLPYNGGTLPDGRELTDFGVLAFTSKRGVAGMANLRARLAETAPVVACVGEATACEAERLLGLSSEIVPEEQTGAGLARAIIEQVRPLRPVLYPRGNKTTGDLQRILNEHGWDVCELEVYENHTPKVAPLPELEAAIAVFASPSAARCFFAANESLKPTLQCIAIGSVTGQALHQLGVKHVTEADQPSHAGLAETVVRVIEQEFKHDTVN